MRRAQPTVVLDCDVPVIVAGKPTLPAYRTSSDSSSIGKRGAAHIHVEPKPDPDAHRPPPPLTGPWHARWNLHDLPEPAGSFYWLGAHTPIDGSSGYHDPRTKQWAADASTPGAPAWHSIYPFKPSVTAVDHYLFGGDVVHHPKGVNFNAEFIEHMWLDWGSARHQPFTWIIAGITTAFVDGGVHHVLDSGRDPSAVGIPHLSAEDCDRDRVVHENLGYRTALTFGRSYATLRTHQADGGATTRCPVFASYNPRMFIGIFNGAASFVGAYSPDARRLRKGSVNNGAGYYHRFTVLGRKHGILSQDHASHMLVFDIRVWNKALTRAQLDEQYDQISSVHQFDRYRRG